MRMRGRRGRWIGVTCEDKCGLGQVVVLMMDGRGDDGHHDHEGRRVRDAAYVA